MEFKKQYTQCFDFCKRLIGKPHEFWRSSVADGYDFPVVSRFFLPAIIIIAIAVFAGDWLTNSEFLFSYALLKALRELFSYLVQFYLVSMFLTTILKRMGVEHAKKQVEHLLAYSMIPFLIVSFITGLFPALYVLEVVGLYGFYLLITGIHEMFSLSKEKQSRLAFLSVLLIILIFGIINVVSWKLLMAFFPYGA